LLVLLKYWKVLSRRWWGPYAEISKDVCTRANNFSIRRMFTKLQNLRNFQRTSINLSGKIRC